jgi:hypothetical protein
MDRDRIIKIKDMIGKIKDKQIFKEIFYISQQDLSSEDGNCKYSHNHNGIFFDLKLLSESTLMKIEELLKQSISTNNTDSETINYNIYYNDENEPSYFKKK